MKFFCGFLVAVSALFAQVDSARIKEYLEMINSHLSDVGFIGNAGEGEIEILRDPEKMAAAAKKTGREIGIVYKDRYWTWINDPVQFPNGSLGVYGRILTNISLDGFAGCAVVPRLEDGRIALNCNFRHATRSWELEIPRGFAEKGETPEQVAKREVQEETGLVVKDVLFLGEMLPDSGKSCSIVPVFLAQIQEKQEARPDESEAIASILFLTPEQIREGLEAGFIELNFPEKVRKVSLRDPFLTFALMQMHVRGLF